jgi:diaminopropionate ammonia-lyase
MIQIFRNQPDPSAVAASLRAAHPFGRDAADGARVVFGEWPAFAATPLIVSADLAQAIDIASLTLKDERARLDLGSFKGLGGAYAVFTLAASSDAQPPAPEQLAAFVARRRAGLASEARALTVTTATAGNHGRSVAAGASLMGIACVIFVYGDVPPQQIEAIAAHGARIVHVDGIYEDAVEQCRATAEAEGWLIVSDTSWDGYTRIPSRIMEGYTVMIAEALADMAEPPTHIFLQAGVGGMAAAVAAHIAMRFAEARPTLIVVEPHDAACLFASAQAGQLATVPHGAPTSMGRLDCYTPSPVAWEILHGLADYFVTVSDAEAEAAVDMLDAAGIETSPSGAAGFAGLLRMRGSAAAADAGLDADSRVLVFLTECRPAPAQSRRDTARSRVAADTVSPHASVTE